MSKELCEKFRRQYGAFKRTAVDVLTEEQVIVIFEQIVAAPKRVAGTLHEMKNIQCSLYVRSAAEYDKNPNGETHITMCRAALASQIASELDDLWDDLMSTFPSWEDHLIEMRSS